MDVEKNECIEMERTLTTVRFLFAGAVWTEVSFTEIGSLSMMNTVVGKLPWNQTLVFNQGILFSIPGIPHVL